MMDVQTPIARDLDPVSSHLAADELQRSGRRRTQRMMVLGMIQHLPGSTAGEIAKSYAMDAVHQERLFYMIERRVSELVLAKVVRRGDVRRCKVRGNPAVTLWPMVG